MFSMFLQSCLFTYYNWALAQKYEYSQGNLQWVIVSGWPHWFIYLYYFIHLTFIRIILYSIWTATGGDCLSGCQNALDFHQANSCKPVETADYWLCRSLAGVCGSRNAAGVVEGRTGKTQSRTETTTAPSPTTTQELKHKTRKSRSKTILFARTQFYMEHS